MAEVTKPTRTESFISALKLKLDALGCPYTEDLSEDAVADVVLSVGEGRLQILQWLMLQYHPKLADILEPSPTTLGWKSESKLQKILHAAHVMCLCHKDDIILIRGEGPITNQVAFIDRLVDLVYSRKAHSHGSVGISRYTDYIDTLVKHESFINMFEDTSLDLIPKDIRAEIDQLNNDNPQIPSLKDLAAQCQNLTQDLDKQSEALQIAQNAYSVQTKDQQNEVTAMSHLLTSTIRELSQLASGFTHCFETHIGMWCEKQAPELNSLGPTFRRVHTALKNFIMVLEEVNTIRQLKVELEKNVKDKSTRTLVTGHGSHEASDSFEDCLVILEEAIHRLEAGFKSKYRPLLTL